VDIFLLSVKKICFVKKHQNISVKLFVFSKKEYLCIYADTIFRAIITSYYIRMTAPTPFALEYSAQFAQLLTDLGISLAVSTYQAGKVILLSPSEGDKLVQLPRTYPNAMGMAQHADKLAVASMHEVVVLKNTPSLAKKYPQKPDTYDAIYTPRALYFTGAVSMHDMEYLADGKLAGVNTAFSCLSYIDDNQSFTPFWKPPFISDLMPEDRCHLNGLATENGEIKYLTALGTSDTPQGWRNTKMNGGVLMHYPSGEIILSGLAMPHSPRIINGELYVLNSAQGELIKVDVQNKSYEVVVKLGGFARGMAQHGDYLFIGVSKLRHNSPAFADLPIAKTSFSGVIAVYLPYKTIVGQLAYKMSVDEIYDVKVIPSKRPSILSPDMPVSKQAIVLPDKSFWAVNSEQSSVISYQETVNRKQ